MTSDSSGQPLVIVRHLRTPSETRHQHARAAVGGTEVRVRRGVYAARSAWEELDARGKHLLRMRAFASTRRRRPLFSHWSAAVLHGLPLVPHIPERVHVSVGRTTGGRSAAGSAAHSTVVDRADVVELDGMLCTSVERTIVDIGAVARTVDAVAMADHFLGGTDGAGEGRLITAWERALPLRGERRAREAIAFADGRAESPLESVSRVAMHQAGVPAPELQVPFADADGFIGRVDFAWPTVGVVAEADGDAKYLDPAFRNGRSAERVVLDEKIREDRLRALGLRVVRWRWKTARDPAALAAKLRSYGVSDGR